MGNGFKYLKKRPQSRSRIQYIRFFPTRHSLAVTNSAKCERPSRRPQCSTSRLPLKGWHTHSRAAFRSNTHLWIRHRNDGRACSPHTRYITLRPDQRNLRHAAQRIFASLGIVGAEKISMVSPADFLVGLFILLGAYFKVANFIQYLASVITGYAFGSALLIATNQIPRHLAYCQAKGRPSSNRWAWSRCDRRPNGLRLGSASRPPFYTHCSK